MHRRGKRPEKLLVLQQAEAAHARSGHPRPASPNYRVQSGDMAANENLMIRKFFFRPALDDDPAWSYVICGRRDQRGAALSPRSARLPGGSPRGFRPRASEAIPTVGSREPALATTGQRLHGSSLIACGSFFPLVAFQAFHAAFQALPTQSKSIHARGHPSRLECTEFHTNWKEKNCERATVSGGETLAPGSRR
jgi:hypothetical protein